MGGEIKAQPSSPRLWSPGYLVTNSLLSVIGEEEEEDEEEEELDEDVIDEDEDEDDEDVDGEEDEEEDEEEEDEEEDGVEDEVRTGPPSLGRGSKLRWEPPSTSHEDQCTEPGPHCGVGDKAEGLGWVCVYAPSSATLGMSFPPLGLDFLT